MHGWVAAGCCGTSKTVKAVARPRARMGRPVWLTPCRASRTDERRCTRMALRLMERARGVRFACGETSRKAPVPGVHHSSVGDVSSHVLVRP